MKDVIQSLWVGAKLSTLERLCACSYLHFGHSFYLYTYEEVKNIPEGVEVKDANQIAPESDIQRFKNLQNFSDWFRFHLLYKVGGWWVDMDTVCLRPFEFPDKHIFVEQHPHKDAPDHICAGWIKTPVESPIMKWCIEKSKPLDWKTMHWSDLGPNLMTKAVSHFKLPYQPYHLFNPIPSWQLTLPNRASLPVNAYSIHLENSAWTVPEGSLYPTDRKKLNKDATYSPDCLYEKLKKRYGVVSLEPSPSDNAANDDFITVIIRGKQIRIPRPKTPKYQIMGQTERARRRGRR